LAIHGLCIGLTIGLMHLLIGSCLPCWAQERNAKVESVLQRAKVFGLSGARFTGQIVEKEALVQVYNYPANSKNRLKDAIQVAKVLINFSPTQFMTVAVRYLDPSNSKYYDEIIIGNKDIVALSSGSCSFDDLVKSIQPIDIGPQDNQTSILNKYLVVAEKQIALNNYWEAEQIVDAALRAIGTAPGDPARLTQDMLNLADGLDARGDLERAERVLKKVLEVRALSGRLNDPDADRTISHLTDLYLSDGRFVPAVDMLNRLLANPTLSLTANPEAYANNLERLGMCHFKNKDYAQSLTEFLQVVNLKRQQKGDRSTALAIALEELGDSYKAQGQTVDAMASYKEAHSIYDHAVVSSSRLDKMDYSIYTAHVKQLDQKLSVKQ